jgi:hypothetical protein
MDDGDPTTAGFNEFERVLDDAVNEFYEENARGDAAIVNVDNDSDDDVIVNVDDDSDAPPNAHEVPSGSKRKLPLPMDVALSTSAALSMSVALLTSAALKIEEATSATLDLAAKNAISPDAFSYGGFTYTRQNIN